MKIAGLVERFDHVCSRYRLRAFESMFAQAGHALTLLEIPSSPFTQFQFYRSLVNYDVVILQRLLIPRLSTKLLRTFSNRLVFDFDDAVWLRDSYHPRGMHSGKRLKRFQSIIRSSDLIVAGNRFLADYADTVMPGKSLVIPTCCDFQAYQPATTREHARTTIVWVGSASTLQGLEQIRWHLEALGQAVPNLELKIICDKTLSLQSLPVDFVPWNPETEIREIIDSDLGIAWMPDDDWSRGKCGLKVVQYLAAGLPVVANAVGVHQEMIRHGETGYLANTAAELIDAVKSIQDKKRQIAMGQAGRMLGERSYSQNACGQLWLTAINHLTATQRRAG